MITVSKHKTNPAITTYEGSIKGMPVLASVTRLGRTPTKPHGHHAVSVTMYQKEEIFETEHSTSVLPAKSFTFWLEREECQEMAALFAAMAAAE